MATELIPVYDAVNTTYWDEIKQGRLVYQYCSCGHAWLPPRALCPKCLGTDWTWKQASGNGELVSWVVYHVAYHPEFKNRLPYNVAIVALEEGPRLITNIVGGQDRLAVGAPVRLAIDTTREVPLAQFELA
ncbi:MAG: OB-fold domain-containing protein [Pigmentiphaga sp.]|uniref:Zn-ribbon domain-containing OB-fold protein n=1 Tax=Pigmentiphaga sp. TaxID=1977564 RepID=UPI0029AD9E82|nr:OB-fold domain-containing protein [Pigmentiphaga sp.]MDX3907035.1 OB-fold domain-containing protein [Pigmentiphaga sp.]